MNNYNQFQSLTISVIVTMSMLLSCVEPIDFDAESFEKVLVVDARITNEFKYHQIKLSNTGRIDSQDFLPEQNAMVKIVDASQNSIVFNETSTGIYTSNQEFTAVPNTTYQLYITTNNGKTYSTKPTRLTSESQIDDLYAAKVVDDLGNTNITIYLDSHSLNGESNYYRYDYEETYKIIPEFWSPQELVVSNGRVIKRDKANWDDRVCFNTTFSNKIIQTQTNVLTNDVVKKFPVIALSNKNPKIGRRYSILVKQYVQTIDANNYFKLLGGLEGNENIFSENQPGYVVSNIISETDVNEKVAGFFEVNSVSEKRIFFSYIDFFPNEIRPYFVHCEGITLLGDEVKMNVENRWLLFYQNFGGSGVAPYLFSSLACGDCRTFGSTVKPDFWVD